MIQEIQLQKYTENMDIMLEPHGAVAWNGLNEFLRLKD